MATDNVFRDLSVGRFFAPCGFCNKMVMHYPNGSPYFHTLDNARCPSTYPGGEA